MRLRMKLVRPQRPLVGPIWSTEHHGHHTDAGLGGDLARGVSVGVEVIDAEELRRFFREGGVGLVGAEGAVGWKRSGRTCGAGWT